MRQIISTALAVCCATSAFGQGLSGASLDISYLAFPDIDAVEATAFSGGIDAEIMAGIGLGASLVRRDQSTDANEADISGLTLHALYRVDNATMVGGFVTREDVTQTANELEILTYGLQTAFLVGPIAGQAHYGIGELTDQTTDATNDVTYYGLDLAYGFGNGWSVIGGGNRAEVTDDFNRLDVAMIEVGAGLALTRNINLAATYGQVRLRGDDPAEEEFYSVTASFAFGPAGAATFDPRGLFQVLKIGF
jgi:hypothetical protein